MFKRSYYILSFFLFCVLGGGVLGWVLLLTFSLFLSLFSFFLSLTCFLSVKGNSVNFLAYLNFYSLYCQSKTFKFQKGTKHH